MKNLLGLEVLHKVPEYRYGKPKSSMREIKNIMREKERNIKLWRKQKSSWKKK